jgi:hypothetical protein
LGELGFDFTEAVLANYGQNSQGQFSYIKADGYTNNGYTLPDGGNIGDTLVWNGSQWAVVAAATTSASPLAAPLAAPLSVAGALQFNDLADQVSTVAATVGQVEETVGQLEQTMGFSQENTVEELVTKINLLNQLSFDSYQLATGAAAFAAAHETNRQATLSLADVAELDATGVLAFQTEVRFRQRVTFEDEIVFSPDMGGVVEIPVGSKSATLTFNQPFSHQPVVSLTPLDLYSQELNYGLTQVSPEGFTVNIGQVASSSIQFNWMAIQTYQVDE